VRAELKAMDGTRARDRSVVNAEKHRTPSIRRPEPAVVRTLSVPAEAIAPSRHSPHSPNGSAQSCCCHCSSHHKATPQLQPSAPSPVPKAGPISQVAELVDAPRHKSKKARYAFQDSKKPPSKLPNPNNFPLYATTHTQLGKPPLTPPSHHRFKKELWVLD